jgi:uncharacterized protein with HEPN domain
MPRSVRVYLEDVLEASEQIRLYVGGRPLEAFSKDRMAVDAVVRNLEIIGEAAKQVPETMRREAPEIPWSKVAGLRDVLVHEYFNVDLEILWDVIQNKLPPLDAAVRRLLGR